MRHHSPPNLLRPTKYQCATHRVKRSLAADHTTQVQAFEVELLDSGGGGSDVDARLFAEEDGFADEGCGGLVVGRVGEDAGGVAVGVVGGPG